MPLRRWSHQPPIGLQYKLNPALPQPWAVFRPLGDKLQAYGAAITSTTYTSVTAATTRDGYGIKIAGANGDGVKVAYTDQMDRSTWAVAVIVRVDGSGTTQTIIGMNGDLNGLQARVNTSAQLELLRQGAVLLVTSSYAGFTAGSVHCVVIRNPNGTSDSITAWANGKLIATNSSGVDNSASDSALYFGQRFAGGSQSLNGAIVEAAHWSGTIPTAEQCQAISADYWGTVIEPMRTPGGIPGAAAGGGGDVSVALSGQAATVSAGTLTPTQSLALSGQAATVSAGTLAPTRSLDLSGSAATVSAGALTPARSFSLTGSSVAASAGSFGLSSAVPLVGSGATFSAGNLTYSAGGNVTLALTGSVITTAAGSLALERTFALGGSQVTVSAGTLLLLRSIALAGSSATSAAGTITPSTSGNITLALTGAQVLAYAGIIVPSGGAPILTVFPPDYGFVTAGSRVVRVVRGTPLQRVATGSRRSSVRG